MTVKAYRGDLDLDSLPSEAKPEDVINAHNKLISAFNFLTKNISLQSNFNCYVAQVKIPAAGQPGNPLAIQHFLGVVPKYRIILRQEGNGVITDIPSGWTSDVITLYNNGSVETTATVMIVRE
jgi:hypothetical protein